MSANITKVGIREFREHLPQYLLDSSPVAITRHGETVGFYIPARHHIQDKELAALKHAAAQLEDLLVKHGINEDELLTEFKAEREEGSK